MNIIVARIVKTGTIVHAFVLTAESIHGLMMATIAKLLWNARWTSRVGVIPWN